MKRIFTMCLFVMFLLSIATGAWATSYTGSILSDATLIATDGWAGGGGTLSWTVDNTTNPGYWTYNYTFTVAQKGISHVIIEVSENFGKNDIISASSGIDPDAPKTYFPPSPSHPGEDNPGMPGDLYGIKWNTPASLANLSFQWTIVTDRAPMWGDFYAKDGKDNQGQIDVYAYNINFGQSTNASIGDGNAGGWALVPDTTVIPEPATMLLLGSGLIGLAGFARRRFKK